MALLSIWFWWKCEKILKTNTRGYLYIKVTIKINKIKKTENKEKVLMSNVSTRIINLMKKKKQKLNAESAAWNLYTIYI